MYGYNTIQNNLHYCESIKACGRDVENHMLRAVRYVPCNRKDAGSNLPESTA